LVADGDAEAVENSVADADTLLLLLTAAVPDAVEDADAVMLKDALFEAVRVGKDVASARLSPVYEPVARLVVLCDPVSVNGAEGVNEEEAEEEAEAPEVPASPGRERTRSQTARRWR
jgi:hypothetical protein